MRLNNGIMKVIILNGSPKAHGNTATALHEVERTLQQQSIARRGGATTTIDVLNKYFLKTNMPVVPSQYWSIPTVQLQARSSATKRVCRQCVSSD